MSEILFIRHAETDMAGTFCGHSNPALNARGRDQLSELIRTLHMEDISAIYASDLLRALETAQAIARSFAVNCHVRPGLREINFGQWEGLTWEEVQHTYSAYAERWIAAYPNLPAPGGERFDDFESRVLHELESLVTQMTSRSIAVVTHAGVLRTVLCQLHGLSEEKAFHQTRSYCSIVRYKTPVKS